MTARKKKGHIHKYDYCAYSRMKMIDASNHVGCRKMCVCGIGGTASEMPKLKITAPCGKKKP